MNFSFKRVWRTWPYKKAVLFGLIAAIIVIVIISLSRGKKEAAITPAPVVPVVSTVTLQDVAGASGITRSGIIEAAESAPLITRAGGRITSLDIALGSQVFSGGLVGRIDGGTEPNPSRVQAATAGQVASLFSVIELQGLISADNAVALATQSLEAAQSGQEVGLETQEASLAIASNGVDRALQGLRQAEDVGQDAAIEAAEIAVEAAKLARSQAVAQIRATNQGVTAGINQAELALLSAQTARDRTRAELASQRAQLAGQAAVAREQLRFQEITAPLTGEVTSLAVAIGDFVSPNQQIGTVTLGGAATIDLSVAEGLRGILENGQTVSVRTDKDELSGVISNITTTPNHSGLFEVSISIPNAPAHAIGQSATVQFPISQRISDTVLVPLDALVARENGTVLFTVDARNVAHEIPVAVRAYYDSLAEVIASLSPSDRIVVTGNRVLQEGESVTTE